MRATMMIEGVEDHLPLPPAQFALINEKFMEKNDHTKKCMITKKIVEQYGSDGNYQSIRINDLLENGFQYKCYELDQNQNQAQTQCM